MAEISRRFSPYTYANDNPMRFIDPDGMDAVDVNGGVMYTGDDAKNAYIQLQKNRPKEEDPKKENENEPKWGSKFNFHIHQAANEIAVLSNGKPKSRWQQTIKNFKVDALNAGTEYADTDQFQTGETSFRHAMRNSNQSVLEAMNKADIFVRSQFTLAKKLLAEGKVHEAYFEFAVGLHTLQDATSPAHGGFQVWNGNESFLEIAGHVIKESIYPGFNSNLQKTSNQYLQWFENSSQPLPKGNLFLNIKTD